MKVPVSWLWDLVDGASPVDTAALAERLTRQGLAVEAVETRGAGLLGGIVAQALRVEAHPNADHLAVVHLKTGSGEATVVTGATNVFAGSLVPYLPPGGRLPSGDRMEARVFRGVRSEGMLLSADEAGLGPDPGGILLLGPASPDLGSDLQPGTDLLLALGIPDAVLDLDLTPNVATFAQSMLGVAREVVAAYGGEVALTAGPAFADRRVPFGEPFPLAIEVESHDDCPQYVLGWVDGPGLAGIPTPFWLRRRLLLSGMRLHGLAVDITNYVMLERGQPLHAFDARSIRGGRIGVRRARAGERLVTLDGADLSLTGDQLVIADAEGPVGLAGVMGGLRSEITAQTREIVLESAEFSPRVVRRSGRPLGFFSEAQSRFEKGVDPAGVGPALERALDLFDQAASAYHIRVERKASGIRRESPERQISLRPARVRGLLGLEIPDPEIGETLQRLGFPVRPRAGALEVTIPTWRGDIEAEVDLVEEVARLTGYDRLPDRLPLEPPTVGRRPRLQVLSDALAEALSAQGLTEVMPSPLVSRREAVDLGYGPDGLVSIQNPLSTEADTLRPSLLPTLLRVARLNLDRGREGVWVFDRGHVFGVAAGASGERVPVEDLRIGGIALGPRMTADWRTAGLPADFFTLKGMLWPLLESVYGPEGVGFRIAAGPGEVFGGGERLHPGRSLTVYAEGREVLALGQLHPALEAAAALDLPGPVIYWEWSLKDVPAGPHGADVPVMVLRMPPAVRDLACVLADVVSAGVALTAIRVAGGELLEDAYVFDVYRGEPVPEGHRSLAFRLRYRAADRTLAEDEIDAVHDRVRQALVGLGGELRS